MFWSCMEYSHHVSLVSSDLWPFFRLSLLIMTLTILKGTGQAFQRMSLDLGVVWCLRTDCSYGVWGISSGEVPGRNYFKEQVAAFKLNCLQTKLCFVCSICIFKKFWAELFQFIRPASLKKQKELVTACLPGRHRQALRSNGLRGPPCSATDCWPSAPWRLARSDRLGIHQTRRWPCSQ